MHRARPLVPSQEDLPSSFAFAPPPENFPDFVFGGRSARPLTKLEPDDTSQSEHDYANDDQQRNHEEHKAEWQRDNRENSLQRVQII